MASGISISPPNFILLWSSRLCIVGLCTTLLLVGGCVKTGPQVEPTAVPIGEMAEHESDPRRAASMRVVEEGRKELTKNLYERAAYHFSRAVEIDSSNPFAYFYLGVTRFRSGQFNQAANLFGRSSDLFDLMNNWRAEALAYRGESLEKTGKIQEAQKAFALALEADASNARAQEGHARLN
ncbi:MAG TPA: hypothetical protein VI895_04000 [Bdellovibrionota bacterium]|nr:hypothetical protein [Bdellovibrionota bacterium]